MCIICNCTCPPHEQAGAETASAFLSAFSSASARMQKAADAMLAVSKIACTPEDRARYDKVHKAMVRQIKDWNRLEQMRETGHGCGSATSSAA